MWKVFLCTQCVYACIYIYTYIYIYDWPIGVMVRVFTNGLGGWGSIPGRVIPKTQKMVLDASLHNTQHYKVQITGKWKNPGKRLVGCWLFGFHGISTFVGYLMSNDFYTNNQFCFKQFSLA